MNTRGTALLTLTLTGVLLLAGGCIGADESSPATPASRASTAAPSPTATQARTELLQALERSQRTAHRYAVRGNLPEGGTVAGTGAFDPAARLFESTIPGLYPAVTGVVPGGVWVRRSPVVHFDTGPNGPRVARSG